MENVCAACREEKSVRGFSFLIVIFSTFQYNETMAKNGGQPICIALTGDMQRHYDVSYRVHAQSFGWLGWARNGAPAGTAGYAKRLEGIEIRLVPKGQAAPGSTARSYISAY